MQATQLEAGQQWDGSNCWPPLLQMALEATINTGDCFALEAVKNMASRYIVSCMEVSSYIY